MASYADSRIRQANDLPVDPGGEYVLYWMQAYRRLDHNHSLDHALRWSLELKRPLCVYEGLRMDYPWASARFHQFILEGMADNSHTARKLGLNYWPFVETPDQPGRGLLLKLAAKSCLVVTDDYPAFIIPGQIAALAKKIQVKLLAVDGNCVVPLSLLGDPVAAAAHLRPRIHRAFPDAWPHCAAFEPDFPKLVRAQVDAPFTIWSSESIAKSVAALPIDQSVRPLRHVTGGSIKAKATLQSFLKDRLVGYAANRSKPAEPREGHASGLSPYLHFGHISIEEVVCQALGEWDVGDLNQHCRGKRDGYYHHDPDVSSFLDEAITWRDVGFHWHSHRNADIVSLDHSLPVWALATLRKHMSDRREHLYTVEQFEAADTHDQLWNAAQTELVETGVIHNYLRMLWGKKVLEWSETPAEAYRTLEHLNNKYAIDGRDPNSYTGILWCFGLFDRPWFPERQVFGNVRYMSSDNTARKFRVGPYVSYVHCLKDASRG